MISVEERLPEYNTYVLAYVPNRPWRDGHDPKNVFFRVVKFCESYGYQPNNKYNYMWDEFGPGSFFGQEVSHWMPLPEPPTQGRDDE